MNSNMKTHEGKAGECLRFFEDYDDFLVCSHPYPDGDSIGSITSTCLFLRAMGKKAQGILFSPTPKRYGFLAGTKELLVYPEDMPNDIGALVCLDVGSVDRIAAFMKDVPDNVPILNIDHHTSNRDFGTVNWNSDAVSCVGEMLYYIMKTSQVPFSRHICEGLYVAIVTDTGRFCYRNTTPATHEVCADLLRGGVDCPTVFQNVYESGTHNRLRLLSLALGTIETAFDGRVSWMIITQDMHEKTRSFMNDSYEFIDLLKSVSGTEVAILYRELEDGDTKISVRSDGSVSAHELCRMFGGGGHRCAAGAVVDDRIEDAVKGVNTAISQLLEPAGA